MQLVIFLWLMIELSLKLAFFCCCLDKNFCFTSLKFTFIYFLLAWLFWSCRSFDAIFKVFTLARVSKFQKSIPMGELHHQLMIILKIVMAKKLVITRHESWFNLLLYLLSFNVTDNVFSIKSWCKKKFNIEEKTLNKQFGIPEEFDYIDWCSWDRPIDDNGANDGGGLFMEGHLFTQTGYQDIKCIAMLSVVFWFIQLMYWHRVHLCFLCEIHFLIDLKWLEI